jgi:L-lactate dehydrogenase (cytochrome)
MQSNLKIYKSLSSVEMVIRTQKRVLVVIKDEVYDLTQFASSHPGGSQILWDNTGKKVDEIFERNHKPGGEALKLIAKYKVGKIQP